MDENREAAPNGHALLSLSESQLLAVARWHHEAANAAGRDGDAKARDRHIAIRNQIRKQLNVK